MQLANSDQPHGKTEPVTLEIAIQTNTKKSTKRSALSKEQKKKGGSVIIALVKMIRPLNSWIAFRSYYAVIFITMPQKVISGFLTHLWQADPTKAKWTILAKAYSDLRDRVGKKKAPLPRFLAINAPFIGVVDPDDYLRIHGWELIDRNGQTILRRTARPDGAAYGSSMLTTNASVEDVIRNSCYHGYINEGDLDFATLSSGMSLIMAASAQPVDYLSFGDLPTFNTGDTAITIDEAGDTASQGPLGIDGIASESSNFPNGSPSLWEKAAVNPGLNEIGAGLVSPDKDVEGELLRHAGTHLPAEKFAAGFDEYDELDEPDPDSSSFDPFNKDQFDAFHLSDLKHSNAADWVSDDAS